MSSHYVWVRCPRCGVSNDIYTGDTYLDDFDDEDWEGEAMSVVCKSCKAKP